MLTYTNVNVRQIIPSEGWCAVFSTENDDEEVSIPVVAWGLVEYNEKAQNTTGVFGMVQGDGPELVFVFEAGKFLRYEEDIAEEVILDDLFDRSLN